MEAWRHVQLTGTNRSIDLITLITCAHRRVLAGRRPAGRRAQRRSGAPQGRFIRRGFFAAPRRISSRGATNRKTRQSPEGPCPPVSRAFSHPSRRTFRCLPGGRLDAPIPFQVPSMAALLQGGSGRKFLTSSAGLLALAKGSPPDPIPNSGPVLTPSAPMVLRLKPRESRSLPGLQRDVCPKPSPSTVNSAHLADLLR